MTYLAAQRIADWPAFLVAVLAHTPAARNQVHQQQPELPPALFGGRPRPASAAAGCSRSGRSSCLPAGSVSCACRYSSRPSTAGTAPPPASRPRPHPQQCKRPGPEPRDPYPLFHATPMHRTGLQFKRGRYTCRRGAGEEQAGCEPLAEPTQHDLRLTAAPAASHSNMLVASAPHSANAQWHETPHPPMNACRARY